MSLTIIKVKLNPTIPVIDRLTELCCEIDLQVELEPFITDGCNFA